jgi:hypothetical protein
MVDDGLAAATFSRMLPYGGTPIRETLKREGRLRGDLTHPDYDFLDLRLNEYYQLLLPTVRPWIYKKGLSYELNYAWDELQTVSRLAHGVEGVDEYREALRALTAESNDRLFSHVEDSLNAFEQGDDLKLDVTPALAYCEDGRRRLLDLRNRFVAHNIDVLMGTVSADCATGPVMVPQTH